MRFISLVFLVCGLAGICLPQEKQAGSTAAPEVVAVRFEKVEVLTDLEEALVAANQTRKPVFVYVFDSD